MENLYNQMQVIKSAGDGTALLENDLIKAIDTLVEDVNLNILQEYDSTDFTESGFWGGAIFSPSGPYKATRKLFCNGAYKISFTTRFVTGAYVILFFDADDILIEGTLAETTNLTDYVVDVPANTQKFAINGYSDTIASHEASVIYENNDLTKKITNDLILLKTEGQDEFNYAGYWSSGTFVPQALYSSFKKKICKGAQEVTYTSRFPQGSETLGFYDITGAFISGVSNDTTVLETNTVDVPETAHFYTLNTYLSDVASTEITLKITDALSYIQFVSAQASAKPDNFIVVDENGTGDYVNIQSALDNANDSISNHVTILLYPGTYSRFSTVDGASALRYISIIGIDKKTCIIRDDTGEYATPPAEIMGVGTYQNLTFYATHDDFSTDQEYYDYLDTLTGSAATGSYCVHLDYNFEDQDVEFINCDFINENKVALGMGTKQNSTFIFTNCKAVGVTVALTAHSSATGTGPNQLLILKDSIFESEGDDSIRLYYVTGGDDFITQSYNCLYWSVNNTVDVVAGILGDKSFGNNLAAMNA